MSQQDIELLRGAYEQFARGDFSAWDDLPDDHELVLAPEMPDAGTYRGESARRWLRTWVASFERLVFEPVAFTDADDTVVVEFIQRGWSIDAENPVELRTWAVMTVRCAEVARTELFISNDAALHRAGLGA